MRCRNNIRQYNAADPTDDFVGNNKNYTHAIGYDVDIAYISNRYSDTPTEYGKTGWGNISRLQCLLH